MSNEISALLNIAEKLVAIAENRRRPQKDPRPNINFRVQPEELIAIDAAAAARGICRSDLIRDALETIIGRAMRSRREIPAGFQRRRKPDAERHKPTHTDIRERDRAVAALAIAAHTAAIDARAAAHQPGILTERQARTASKLSPR